MADRVEFLDIGFDPLDLGGALAALAARRADQRCRMLVTPNVDHVVRAQRAARDGDGSLLATYRAADWCLCDSRVLSRLAGLYGVFLPVVPGSDLTRRLLAEVCEPGDRIAIVGGGANLPALLCRSHSRLRFVQHRPPMGLRHDAAAIAAAVDFAAASGARFTLLAVGSPQQEMIAHAARDRPGARGTMLCVGASLDFLTGAERRAPKWVQQLSLEWAYRLALNPRRMWRRYLVDGPAVFSLSWQWRQRNG